MLAEYSPLEDDWRIFDIPASGNRLAHIAGVYRVYNGDYYCSLIQDSVYKVPEFMAFKWNCHAKKVTNWMEVFSFSPIRNSDGGIADVDAETFQECMNKFYDFLIQKEKKNDG